MTPDDLPEDWVALYAAGALPPAEVKLVEELLARDPHCLAELRTMDVVIRSLTDGAGRLTPSPSVREALLRRIRAASKALQGKKADADLLDPSSHNSEANEAGHETVVIAGSGNDSARDQMGAETVSDVPRKPRAPGSEPVRARQIKIHLAAEAEWLATTVPGIAMRILSGNFPEGPFDALLRMDPGVSLPAHTHDGEETSLIIEGDLRVGDRILGPGDYQCAGAGTEHPVQTTTHGCLALVTGIHIRSKAARVKV